MDGDDDGLVHEDVHGVGGVDLEVLDQVEEGHGTFSVVALTSTVLKHKYTYTYNIAGRL